MPGTIGLVTIGQSPRTDLAEEYAQALPGCTILQAGALDDLSEDEILALAPGPTDDVLVSRLRTGREVRLARRHLEPRLQSCLDRLSRDAALTVLLCTGEFSGVRPRGIVLLPHRVLHHIVAAVVDGLGESRAARLGVIVPDAAQRASAESRWSDLGRVTAVAASPYRGPAGLEAAADALNAAAASVVVMDCIGFTRAMRQVIARRTTAPTILANASVAMIARELLEGRA